MLNARCQERNHNKQTLLGVTSGDLKARIKVDLKGSQSMQVG